MLMLMIASGITDTVCGEWYPPYQLLSKELGFTIYNVQHLLWSHFLTTYPFAHP